MRWPIYSAAVWTVIVGSPAGVQAGDVLLAQIVIAVEPPRSCRTHRLVGANIRRDSVNGTNKLTSWLYYKVAGVNEPSSYAWSITPGWAGESSVRGEMLPPRRSITLREPLRRASVRFPSQHRHWRRATTAKCNVYFYGAQAFAGPTITPSGGLAQRFNAKSSKEGFTLAIGDLGAPLAGIASPTYTASATISGTAAMTGQAVLLAPFGAASQHQ